MQLVCKRTFWQGRCIMIVIVWRGPKMFNSLAWEFLEKWIHNIGKGPLC